MRTLTTRTDGAAFESQHERVMTALCKGPAPMEFPAYGALVDRYAPEVVEAAVFTWRERMINEHRSSAVFAALVPQLIEASTTVDVQTVVLRAATDEIYHAVLCGEVVRAFGAEPVAEAEPTLPTMPAQPGIAPLERAVRHVMFVGCLAETVAVSLITEERELSKEPLVREVLTRILSDEIEHARLGWRFLADSLPKLDAAARQRLSTYLRTAFAYLERRELALLPLTPPMDRDVITAREHIGLCQGEHARALFFDTVSTVIVPRLDEMGLGASQAFRERREPAAA